MSYLAGLDPEFFVARLPARLQKQITSSNLSSHLIHKVHDKEVALVTEVTRFIESKVIEFTNFAESLFSYTDQIPNNTQDLVDDDNDPSLLLHKTTSPLFPIVYSPQRSGLPKKSSLKSHSLLNTDNQSPVKTEDNVKSNDQKSATDITNDITDITSQATQVTQPLSSTTKSKKKVMFSNHDQVAIVPSRAEVASQPSSETDSFNTIADIFRYGKLISYSDSKFTRTRPTDHDISSPSACLSPALSSSPVSTALPTAKPSVFLHSDDYTITENDFFSSTLKKYDNDLTIDDTHERDAVSLGPNYSDQATNTLNPITGSDELVRDAHSSESSPDTNEKNYTEKEQLPSSLRLLLLNENTVPEKTDIDQGEKIIRDTESRQLLPQVDSTDKADTTDLHNITIDNGSESIKAAVPNSPSDQDPSLTSTKFELRLPETNTETDKNPQLLDDIQHEEEFDINDEGVFELDETFESDEAFDSKRSQDKLALSFIDSSPSSSSAPTDSQHPTTEHNRLDSLPEENHTYIGQDQMYEPSFSSSIPIQITLPTSRIPKPSEQDQSNSAQPKSNPENNSLESSNDKTNDGLKLNDALLDEDIAMYASPRSAAHLLPQRGIDPGSMSFSQRLTLEKWKSKSENTK